MSNNPHPEPFFHGQIGRDAVVIDPALDYDPGTHGVSTASGEAPRACLEKNGVHR